MTIARYGLGREYAGNTGSPAITEQADGAYVRYEDHQRLEAAHDAHHEMLALRTKKAEGAQPSAPENAEAARDLIWQLRAALVYQKLVDLPWKQALDCAGGLLESGGRKDGYKPADAVREDLTYWAD